MYRQTGRLVGGEWSLADLHLLGALGAEGERKEAARGLPTFVSAAPPRSEGEALLRRIFSPPERV
jgi:hypothetical protein